jgi:sugar phosphate isomerase/epimerase
MMKVGASSWSYNRAFQAGEMTQESWLRECYEIELDGVELLDRHFPKVDLEYLRHVKTLCTQFGLTISCLSASNDFGKAESELETQIDLVESWIKRAEYLGAPVVRVFAGWKKPGMDYSTVYCRIIESMKKVAQSAEDRGIFLGLENHDGNSFMTTPEDVMRIIQDVGNSYLRLNLDTGAYPNLLHDIEKTASLAIHVHAKVYNANTSELDPDHSKILPLLEKARFNGFLSIEYEGEQDERTAVRLSSENLRRLLAV